MPEVKPECILVVDLEATCWDQPLPSTGEKQTVDDMEVIEFGCALATADGEVLSSASFMVKPVVHPELSNFCKGLTGIEQEQVDAAPRYAEAVAQLDRWLSEQRQPDLWCSWGNYDNRQLQAEERRHQVAPAFMQLPHYNLKQVWCQSHDKPMRTSLRKALAFHNMEFRGRLHRGIDDAENIARLLPYVNWQLAEASEK
ncbi:3'-5' exonuclease [Pseudidiomarina sp.]|uniref:3'-5' exonuclease n=1 Tax=Pseudidiomarina sp. TaxID=2081707 RepID=UPI00299CF33F|nr:3'-5' exonuclease [Pseudidiomarina sp.]MDX1706145.1 3'-5' exonuclease [Pseudidiomarina sp.]